MGPELLKQALFEYFVDCAIPFVAEKELEEGNVCELCGKIMICPSVIDGCVKKHQFCKKCIVLWQGLINNPEIGTLNEDDPEKNKVKVGDFADNVNDIVLPKYCPLYTKCFAKLGAEDIK